MDNKAFQNIQKKLGLTNEGTAEAMDVELFTVRQWASGLWPVPRPIVKFLRTLLSINKDKRTITGDYLAIHTAAYREGYDEGYKICKEEESDDKKPERIFKVGYENGHHDGHIEGYVAGRKQGHHESHSDERLNQTEGYTEGYDDGYKEGKAVGRREEKNHAKVCVAGYGDAIPVCD